MSYSVVISEYALKQLKKLDKSMIPKIKEAISALQENPRPFGYKKLKGEDAYRIRLGNYRVIYEIHDNKLIVVVIDIDHRKQIYK